MVEGKATRRTILLGAGVSVEGGVPAAKEMARRAYDATKRFPDLARAAEVAIGGVRSHRSIAHKEPFGEVDIEDLYQVLCLLAERSANPLAPFVGSWSHATVAAERPSSRHLADLTVGALAEDMRNYGDARLGSITGSDFNRLHLLLDETLAAGGAPYDTAFYACAQFVLRQVIQASWIRVATKTEYLHELLRSASHSPLWIASLNYDNAIELAGASTGVSVDTGLHTGSMSVRFKEDSPVCLAKLHGSANWSFDPHGRFQISEAPAELRTAMVFGAGNKLQVNGPYLDLLFAFRSQLEMSNKVEVCGYSFRDQHINYLLLSWLNSDPARNIEVFDPQITDDQIAANIAMAMPSGWAFQKGQLSSRLRIRGITASKWANPL
jgi:hypothetical protein